MLNKADSMKPVFGFCNNSLKNLTGSSTQIRARSKLMGGKDRKREVLHYNLCLALNEMAE
jgi:hypothetical protein